MCAPFDLQKLHNCKTEGEREIECERYEMVNWIKLIFFYQFLRTSPFVTYEACVDSGNRVVLCTWCETFCVRCDGAVKHTIEVGWYRFGVDQWPEHPAVEMRSFANLAFAFEILAWWHFLCYVKLLFSVSFDVSKHAQVHIVQCEIAHHIHSNTYNWVIHIFIFCTQYTWWICCKRYWTIEKKLNIAHLFTIFLRLIYGTTCSVEMKWWNVKSFEKISNAAIFIFSTVRMSFSTTTNYTLLLCHFNTLIYMRITNNDSGIL